MVAKNNAVFRFLLDIKDFVNKGRKVIQINNQISGSTQKASNSMDKLQDSTKKTGDTMAANAVNFQTATQGMLNLTTAGVQTFTSFSNLDRAGNRLAQAQIGVSRATDLLNNKQLRLNELIAKGQGNSQKAVLLTNELATARADLLVKTDKLKIEEGALLDIQLLFVTNIANVMISSMQTVISLKNAHIGSTIKQIAQERLLSTTIFTKTIPAITSQNGAMLVYNTTAKTVINTNRLLMLGIPGIGAALLGVSVAVEAYNDNWGGFRDMIQSILPFMRDQKKLLGDVTDELNGTADAAAKLNGEFEEQVGLVFRLPDSYIAVAKGLEKVEAGYNNAVKKAKEFNIEVAKNPQSFRVATQQGGFLPTSQQGVQVSGSNVIRVEGDAVNTASSIRSSSISRPATNELLRMASSGVLPQAFADTGISQKTTEPIITNTAGGIYRQNSIYDLINIFDPTTQAGIETAQFIKRTSDAINKDIATFNQGMTSAAEDFNEWAETNKIDLRMPTSFGEFITKLGTGLGRDYDATRGSIIGIDQQKEQQILKSREMIKEQLESGTAIPFGTISNIFRSKPGGGKFVGGGAFFEETGAFTFTGSDDFMIGLKDQLSKDKTELQKLRSLSLQERMVLDPMGFRELELSNEIINIEGRINEIETTEEGLKNIILQDMLLKETITDIVPNIEAQADFRKRQEAANQKLQEKIIRDQIQQDRENEIRLKIKQGARKHGISESLYAQRTGLGIILKSLSTDTEYIPSNIKSALTQMNVGKHAIGTENVFKSEKVKEAERIRKRLEAGIFHGMGLPDDTLHDRLVLRSFGRVGGITLSSDDPLLKDISHFGERRAEIYSQRMIDPITGQDMGAMGIDIGRVADTISLEEGKRIARLQKEMKAFRGAGGGSAGIAAVIAAEQIRMGDTDPRLLALLSGSDKKKTFDYGLSSGIISATAAYQVPRGSIRRNQKFIDEMKERDRLVNLQRFGGFSSRQEWREAGRRKTAQAFDEAQIFADFFTGIGRVSSYTGKSDLRGQLGGIKQRADTIKSALSSAGLSYKRFNARTGLPYRYTAHQYYQYMRDWNEVRAFNDNQYAKAKQINILQQDFGLTGFTGSALTLPSLQDEVAKQDALIKSIGLDRTEAFQIVDTEGRGREEIDDRIRFKDRMNSMSTGVSVL